MTNQKFMQAVQRLGPTARQFGPKETSLVLTHMEPGERIYACVRCYWGPPEAWDLKKEYGVLEDPRRKGFALVSDRRIIFVTPETILLPAKVESVAYPKITTMNFFPAGFLKRAAIQIFASGYKVMAVFRASPEESRRLYQQAYQFWRQATG